MTLDALRYIKLHYMLMVVIRDGISLSLFLISKSLYLNIRLNQNAVMGKMMFRRSKRKIAMHAQTSN